VTARAAPAVLIALSTVALGGCGNKVDRQDLETKIAGDVQRRTGTTVTVRCPDGVKPDKGTRVRCTTVLSGADANIDILFTANGKFRITQTRLQNP
jgi:hypothetical protein